MEVHECVCACVCRCTCCVDVWVVLPFTPQDGPLGIWIEASFTKEICGFGTYKVKRISTTQELADTPVLLFNLKIKLPVVKEGVMPQL